METELSGPADLFIQFINSTFPDSVDIAAHTMSKNVLMQPECWCEVKCRRKNKEGDFLSEGMACCCLLHDSVWSPWSQVAKVHWLVLTTPVPLLLGEFLESFPGSLCISGFHHLHPSARDKWD